MIRRSFVAPLDPSTLVYSPDTPTFAGLAHSALGNAGDAGDGFDRAFASTAGALNEAGNLLGAIDQTIGLIDGAQTALDRIPTADIDAAIQAGQSADAAASIDLGGAIQNLSGALSVPQGFAPAPKPPIYGIPGIGVGQSGSTGVSGGVSLGGPAIATTAGLAIGEAATVTITSGLVTAGTGLATVLGAVATFAPVVGAFIGLALLLSQFIGGGCGAPCVEGSKVEQIYEAFADNLLKLYKLGMINRDQALAGMALAIQQGQQHEAQLGTAAARRGSQNLYSVIQAEITDVNVTKPAKARPYDAKVAHASYVSGPGWYPDSLASATELTDEYVTSLK